MRFEQLEARYVKPEMKQAFSLGDIGGLPRTIGPKRDMVVLRGTTSTGIEGWSAIDTTPLPVYSSESTVEAWALVTQLGQQFVGKEFASAREAVRSLGYLIDHPMFEGAFANLYLDALAIQEKTPLSLLLGGTKEKVEVGVSISKNATADDIQARIEKQFRRIKIKVSPTKADYEKIAAIRRQFPQVMLMVDANSSFQLTDVDHRNLLMDYGRLGLLMIEQPLAHDDIADHIKLQKMFNAKGIPGKVCLDESIHTMEDLQRAVTGNIPIINIKVTRVGGLDIAKTMIEYCQSHGVDTWIGGTMELTAPGKAHSLAMASHPGVTLPSDISGTDAYFLDGQDPTVEPMNREPDGAYIKVPTAPGRGFTVDREKMDAITDKKVIFQAT